jgi:hypothetical protein
VQSQYLSSLLLYLPVFAVLPVPVSFHTVNVICFICCKDDPPL